MQPSALGNGAVCNSSGRSKSIWMEVHLPSFTALEKNISADVCIVGGGIVGLTCAYTLAKLGKSVVLLDKDVIGGGQTVRTTAHLTWALDDRYYDLIDLFGVDGARLAAESHSAAIDYIEKIVKEEQIDCDFERVDGYLFASPEDSKEILDKELAAIQKLGMPIKKIERAPFSETFDTGPCLQFPNQAQFHILKYLNGLIKGILKYGGRIYSHTDVKHIEDGALCKIDTQSGVKVTAKSVIVATCTPINDRFFIHTKQAAYRTYVVATTIPKGSVAKGLYWDTLDPYHYVRIQNNLTDPNSDWLIVGGEDHKTGQEHDTESKYRHLETWAKFRFPMVDKFSTHWSGQVYEPVDSLAFIGRNPWDKNIYISTGDSGNGMTHGTIAGILLPDLILGKQNPWKDLYDPSRKTLSAASEYIKENLNSFSQLRDWLTPGEINKIEGLAPDEGIILREGLKKLAVYKDEANQVHINSAFCPHLGGCLRWNPSEKSWDCPLHGSRFDGCGLNITGPAISDLKAHTNKNCDS